MIEVIFEKCCAEKNTTAVFSKEILNLKKQQLQIIEDYNLTTSFLNK